jgi:hypothetical protein
MEKIKSLIPGTLFVLFCIKSLFISPSASEVAICFILAAITAIFTYIEKITTVKSLELKIEENNKKVDEYLESVNALRNSVDSVKMSIGMRNNRG